MKKSSGLIAALLVAPLVFGGTTASAALIRGSGGAGGGSDSNSDGGRGHSSGPISGGGSNGGGHSEWGHGSERGAESRGLEPPVVIKRRNYSIGHPDRIRNSNNIVRDRHQIDYPERDGTGAAISKSAARVAPQEHTSIVRNTTIIRNIQNERRTEIVPNKYYWHDSAGVRYCHYYDRGGVHWYGFYFGPTFYWTRYYGDHWWWFDARFDRWVYWWGGYWWWPSPTGVVYVYMDNNYYPYQEGVVTVKQPEVEAPPEGAPSSHEGSSYQSPDGRRTVQVFGDRDEAFLYNSSSGQASFMKYLGAGVEKVRFAGGKNGKPLQILIDFKDGTFAFFTDEGQPIDANPDKTELSLPSGPPPGAKTPPPAEPPPQPQ
ncbi:MAG: hypothetical protein JO102_00210 [Elusimicrobia bacterium]|nr:hypothetical protein [Elusimicrobiota bacterium]